MDWIYKSEVDYASFNHQVLSKSVITLCFCKDNFLYYFFGYIPLQKLFSLSPFLPS